MIESINGNRSFRGRAAGFGAIAISVSVHLCGGFTWYLISQDSHVEVKEPVNSHVRLKLKMVTTLREKPESKPDSDSMPIQNPQEQKAELAPKIPILKRQAREASRSPIDLPTGKDESTKGIDLNLPPLEAYFHSGKQPSFNPPTEKASKPLPLESRGELLPVDPYILQVGDKCFSVQSQSGGLDWWSLPSKCKHIPSESDRMIQNIEADMAKFRVNFGKKRLTHD